MTSIYPYGPPTEVLPNLYQVTGSLPFPVPRNMTVVRTDKEELVLYSAIAMHEAGMKALEALGTPKVLVIPHRRHQMDAAFYKALYPKLVVVAPEPSRAIVAVSAGLSTLESYGIKAYVLPGNTYQDVVMDIALKDGHAIAVCETLGNLTMSGWLKPLFRLLGPPGGGFGVARAVRWREIRGSEKLRHWLSTEATRSDIKALLFGHGPPITSHIEESLRRAAATL